MLSDRVQRLQSHIRDLNAAGVRRTTFFGIAAASLRASSGQPPPVRRARAFADLLDNVPPVILPHELISGSILGMWPLADNLPSYRARLDEARRVMRDYLAGGHETERGRQARWALMARDHFQASVSYEDLQRLIRDVGEDVGEGLSRRDIGRELERHFSFDYSADQAVMAALPWGQANHLDLNYGKVVRLGLGGIRSEIDAYLEATDDPGKRVFYDVCRLAIDAASRLVLRYADTLAAEADRAADPRRTELRTMAAVCRRVAGNPPGTFREALQLVWLMHIAANIQGGNAMSFARLDQYLAPLYLRDLQEGVCTRAEAAEWLACVWLKVNEPHMRTVQSLCLGGMTPSGVCGVNDLTRLCLQVCRELREPYPNVSARVTPDDPDWYLDEIVDTIRAGFGQPMILNDRVWVPNLTRLGYTPEDARDYYNMGCVEIMIMGKVGRWRGAGGILFPELVNDLIRNVARDPDQYAREQSSFEAFFSTCLALIETRVDELIAADAAGGQFTAPDGACDPFGSALLDDCLVRGRDMFAGGCRYPDIRPVSGNGLGTAADSLAAVRACVYEHKTITLAELAEALTTDFSGHEGVRRMLMHSAIPFGNDDDATDDLAARMFAAFGRAVERHNRDGRGPYVTLFFTYTGHVSRGESLGATANGRHAGDTISNGIGPTQGRDTHGPTAVVNSVCRLDHRLVNGAYALNLKFLGDVLAPTDGAEALRALLSTYIAKGGPQVQINVVDQGVLEAAVRAPEKHGDLVVRVGGYCEHFVRLDRELQQEIIRRSAHRI